MKRKLPARPMREHPDLEQLKRQARELLDAYQAGDAAAVDFVNAYFDEADSSVFALHHAQLAIARSYGFDSWPKLKAYVDGITIRRLVEAVCNGQLEQVRTMLKPRPELARMTVSYGDEHRAIHYAVIHRQPEIVRLLMRHGANARAGIDPHRDATSTWTLAHERGFEEIVAVIEEEERRRPKPVLNPETPATAQSSDDLARSAAANGDLEWLRARLADGKLTNPVRWEDGGLLTVAVRNNRREILELSLAAGFDPDERVSYGEGDWVAYSQGFPLWHAAALGQHDIANLLLDRGANPNVQVDSSGSPVYSAYSHKQWQMVELLRARGGIITADIAAIYHQTELAGQILNGEVPNLQLSEKTPAEELLRFGAGGGAVEIVRMSLRHIDWAREDARWFRMLSQPLSFWHHIPWLYAGNKAFHRNDYLSCFRLILNACDVNVAGSFGRAILHEIAAMGDWITEDEVAAFGDAALEAGARMDRRDEILLSTPLGWACRWGRLQLVQLLLEHGADPVENDAEPWARPRSWARKMGHERILQLLG